ncbi:MAG: HD domain-containing protein [Eubacterium sp.]|nr:HD domain-containing protein [Eubacterium sp.]
MYEDKVTNRLVHAKGDSADYMDIISSFVSAVDAKDSYTADHSERVGMMSKMIAQMLGLSEASVDEIHMAACLHDIGKIGIPDSILCKKGKLNDNEWHIMMGHTVVGEDIIKHNKAFYDVSQIIRHHHERFDGNGYPDGISGLDIPLGARIVAIADSIDAMTSSRSYREARTFDFCRQEISRNLGVMYDPAIGEIVLENWNEIKKIELFRMQRKTVIQPPEVVETDSKPVSSS